MTSEEFGNLIRERRAAKGWTQTQLAERCGTGKRFIVDLEAGKPTSHLGKALAAAREVGIELVDRSVADLAPATSRDADDDLSFLPKF